MRVRVLGLLEEYIKYDGFPEVLKTRSREKMVAYTLSWILVERLRILFS